MPLNRRDFVKRVALTAAGAAVGAPAILRARGLNDKLNIAMIAAGGRGAENLKGVAAADNVVNIVALCDVDANALDKSGADYPLAKRFVDFRKMFDDPKAFVKPWTVKVPFKLVADSELLEGSCAGHQQTMEHRRVTPAPEPPSR